MKEITFVFFSATETHLTSPGKKKMAIGVKSIELKYKEENKFYIATAIYLKYSNYILVY